MEEGKGQVNGFRLVVRQGKSNCRRDAAASLPPRPGANVFVFAVARVHFVGRGNRLKRGWWAWNGPEPVRMSSLFPVVLRKVANGKPGMKGQGLICSGCTAG